MSELRICYSCSHPFASDYHIRCHVCRASDRANAAKKILAVAELDLVRAKAERDRAQHTHRLWRDRRLAATGDNHER